jgi:hypothetical protein
MIRLTREQMREASEAIDRFHQLANVAQKTTDLEEHRRLWSEASEIQRQLQELLTSADDGTWTRGRPRPSRGRRSCLLRETIRSHRLGGVVVGGASSRGTQGWRDTRGRRGTGHPQVRVMIGSF